jgi:hypothetical protein
MLLLLELVPKKLFSYGYNLEILYAHLKALKVPLKRSHNTHMNDIYVE